MPKIGPYQIPNHDIDTVVELIDEAYARVNVGEGEIDEETFREEVLQRRGGSYSRYRFDLQLFGFIERSHGADEVEITSLFLNVADPVPRSARDEAISEAVTNVDIFVKMFSAGFEPGFSERELRVWLIQELNVPRGEAQEDAIQELRELYEPAHPHLKRNSDNGESKQDEESRSENTSEDSGQSIPSDSQRPEEVQNDEQKMEVIQIGNKYVRLPKENIGDEWQMLKTTVDAYINSLEGIEQNES